MLNKENYYTRYLVENRSVLKIQIFLQLLQNICNIPPHKKGWGVAPNHEDSSLAARIDRINAHKKSFVEIIEYSWRFIGDYQFEKIWNEIRKDVLEIEKQIFGTFIFERCMDNIYDRHFKTSKTQKSIRERQQGKSLVQFITLNADQAIHHVYFGFQLR